MKCNNKNPTKPSRLAYAELACKKFNHPSHELTVIGVTGTNGKTTSTYLLESILNAAGYHTAVIGTIEYRFKNQVTTATLTTPDALDLQKLLREFKESGATAVVMEVSSHGLDQYRVGGMQFSAVLFTNLTQDHLDYHGNIERYFEAKAKLFLDYPTHVRVIHLDESGWGQRLADLCEIKGLPYYTVAPSSILYTNTKESVLHHMGSVDYSGLLASINGIFGELKFSRQTSSLNKTSGITSVATVPINSSLLGRFNIQNTACSAAVGIALQISQKHIAEGIKQALSVPGRLELIPNTKGLTIVVDYAHTPDALEKALRSLREFCSGKLICIFGCGGNRDSSKRSIMGRVAEKYSDEMIITNDNPRNEDPEAIIQQITQGLQSPAQATIVTDRKQAIKQAILSLNPGDCLLIAGKGHETYQIIGNQKLYFDDRKVVQEYFAGH